MPNVTLYDKVILTGLESIEVHAETPQPVRTTVDDVKAFVLGEFQATPAEVDVLSGFTGSSTDVEVLSGVATLETPVNGVKATLTIDPGVDGNDAVIYTAYDYGFGYNDISVEHLGGVSQDLAVTWHAETLLLSVQLATDGGGLVTSTAAEVVAAVTAVIETGLWIEATFEGTGAGIAGEAVAANLAGGIDTTPGAVGTFRIQDDADPSFVYFKVLPNVWKKIALDAL